MSEVYDTKDIIQDSLAAAAITGLGATAGHLFQRNIELQNNVNTLSTDVTALSRDRLVNEAYKGLQDLRLTEHIVGLSIESDPILKEYVSTTRTSPIPGAKGTELQVIPTGISDATEEIKLRVMGQAIRPEIADLAISTQVYGAKPSNLEWYTAIKGGREFQSPYDFSPAKQVTVGELAHHAGYKGHSSSGYGDYLGLVEHLTEKYGLPIDLSNKEFPSRSSNLSTSERTNSLSKLGKYGGLGAGALLGLGMFGVIKTAESMLKK